MRYVKPVFCALVVTLGLSLLAGTTPAHAARQSSFTMLCPVGAQAQLVYVVSFEHYSLAWSNYCYSGKPAANAWIYPKDSDGKVLSAVFTILVDSTDKTEHTTCVLMNGSQKLYCPIPNAADPHHPLTVFFEYAID